jgi:hypothetical protein
MDKWTLFVILHYSYDAAINHKWLRFVEFTSHGDEAWVLPQIFFHQLHTQQQVKDDCELFLKL